MMGATDLQALEQHMRALTKAVPLNPVKNESQYERAVAILSRLLDAGGANERHPFAALAALLGERVAAFEKTAHRARPASPAGMLRFLMQQHGLKQADLPEVGSQGVVSELLSGKRALNSKQIAALSKR